MDNVMEGNNLEILMDTHSPVSCEVNMFKKYTIYNTILMGTKFHQ